MSQYTPSSDEQNALSLPSLASNHSPLVESLPGSRWEPIAIVGIGCRFPGAHGPEVFWQLLCNGVDAITEVPPDRFDVDAVYDARPATPGKIVTRRGGFLDHIDEFDADFFGISPREAGRMDPQQRLLLEVAWEALEDAGQLPERLPIDHTGVYVGLVAVEYEDLLFEAPANVNVYSVLGSGRSAIAGRVSYALGLQGPSLALDTACSSSLVAIHLACQSLRSGECRVALAGGVNLVLLPKYTMGYSQAGMLAPDGRCKAFDARANGFVRSEGAAVIVLKSLSQAQADGDPIYAVIRGSAVNNDGRSGGLLMTPSQPGQEAVLRAAYADAGVSPGRVQYVEAHGTGTSVGDPVETRALGAVLGANRPSDLPCRIGSVKTNIGHTEGAAGVAGVIKTALALKHRMLPPSLHCQEPNPNIPWQSLPLMVQRELSAWPEHDGHALAGVSSFGIAGTNAHVVLEEAPEAPPHVISEAVKTPHLLPLSAHSREALDSTARAYQQLLAGGREQTFADLRDLCYTASVRRTHHDYRMAVVGSNPQELALSLAAALREEARPGLVSARRVHNRARKIVFVCPGQGGQWFGMARQLLEREPAFHAALEACDRAMRRYVDWSLLDELHAPEASSRLKEGMEEIDVLQPALFAIQVGLAATWRSWGIEPDAVVGHSMGEVAAAYIAGALSLDDAARVICLRSRLLRTVSGRGGMAVTDLTWEQAERAVSGYEGRVAIAAANGPSSTVLSGDLDALTELLAELERQNVFCRLVRVDVASHSPQMDPLRTELLRLLDGMQPQRASVPIYSTVAGAVSDGLDMDATYWMRNLRQPVLFFSAVRQLLDDGHDTFVELSPQPTLVGAVQQTLQRLERDGVALASMRRAEEERAVLLETLGMLYTLGCSVDWTGVYPDGGRCVPLPLYAWQHERFWLDDGAEHRRRTYAGTAIYRGETGAANDPLLGHHVTSAAAPGIHLWETDLSVQQFAYLADHRVQGKIVLPGAAYAEMALEAVRQVFGGGECVLDRLSFQRALFLPEDGAQRIQVAIAADAPDAPRTLSFQLFSLQDSPEAGGENAASSSWTLHASGTIRVAERQAGAREPAYHDAIDLIQARCGEEITAAEYYQFLRERGLEYGPAFQGIAQVWRRDGEAIAQIQLPASIEAGAGAYQIHPALLDACFQALLAALPRAGSHAIGDDVYLPVEIELLHVEAQLRPDLVRWCHTLAEPPTGSDEDTHAGDVYLLDDQGQVLLQARGLKIRRLERQPASAQDDEDADGSFYQVDWQQAPPPSAAGDESQRARAPGRWLIFGDTGGTGQALASLLQAEGEACVVVSPGWSYAYVNPAQVQINPTHPEDFRRLLADTQEVDDLACCGIVHLWSLEARPPESTTLTSLQTVETLGPASVLHLVQALAGARLAESPRLWLITRGAQPVGVDGGGDISVAQAPLLGLARVLPHEHPELRCVRVDLSDASQEDELRALVTTLLADEREDEIALRGAARYVPRLVRRPPDARETGVFTTGVAAHDDTPAQFGEDEPFHVEITRAGILDNLAVTRTVRSAPGPGQVEIRALAGGLNFMDVIRAMGMYPGQPDGPIPLGCECAGTIEALGEGVEGFHVGDEVIVTTTSSGCCLSRFVTTDVARVMRKPAGLSWEEAATLPIVFLTVSYALEHLARLAPGERVLIHSAAGGVGLAAIQLAQSVGAEVFATAGSEEKRQYLRSLGVRHVMDSRSLAFADQVMELTGNEGVDVVLNSLPGEAIPKSMSTLRAYGRFIEIGKKDIYGDTRLDLSPFRNNLSFFAVDIDRLANERPALMGSILRSIGRRVEEGLLKPIPTRTFPLAQVTDAFRYFAQAKHIGKIAVALGSQPAPSASDGSPVPGIRADATYLITGGLGGLGLTVARWMVEQGARHLVLTGRSAPSSTAEQAVEELQRTGARVRVERADVARESDVVRVLAHIAESMPPLRGVIHAAGVLDDGILLQLDQQRLQSVMAPKVHGAWNLHSQTSQLSLDFFVLFSSAASLIGSPGQGNYTAANAFLDALAHYRRARGLPALSINWGAWSEVGLAVRPDRGGRLAQRGLRSFTPQRGVEALSRLLQSRAVQVAVMPFDAQEWRRFYPGADVSSLLVQLLREAREMPSRTDHQPRDAGSLREDLLVAKSTGRQERMHSYLAEQVARVLRLTASKVDVDRPLTTLGLDSLMAVELRNRIEADLDVTVSVVELLQGPSIATLAAQLVEQLAETEATPARPTAPPAPARVAPAEFPLSYGQRAMWFLYQLAPESAAYNVAFAARMEADLDVAALRQSFQALMDRHPILRTTFSAAHGAEPTQHVHERMEVAFLEEDASTWAEAVLSERLVAQANRPFDLEHGPQLRVAVFARPAGDYVLLFTAHHIVVDFWSMVVMMEELRELYAAARAGRPAQLPPPGQAQYADFVEWQRDLLVGPRAQELWSYWRDQLAGAPATLDLPTDRPRPPVQTYRGISRAFKINLPLTGQLKRLAQAHGTTLSTVLLAAYQVLLSRYSGQCDIVVGSPMAGRSRADFEEIVGYFVNPVPLRADLSDDPSFAAFLVQMRETMQTALEHQDFPFPLMVERLHPVRDPARSPVFQAVFTFQTPHRHSELSELVLGEAGSHLRWGELDLESLALEQRVAQFDLTMMAVEASGGISASLEANADLFDAMTVARMAEHFRTLLAGIAADPLRPVSLLPLLPDEERQRMLAQWNATDADYPREACLPELFEAQVARTPDAVALVFEERQLTYRELNERANQLAHALRALNVGPESLVGVYVERSPDMVAAVLGVLKAGGAYVPLDPTFPSERIAFMLQDAQPSALVTHWRLRHQLPEWSGQVVSLDSLWDGAALGPAGNMPSVVRPENAAYVMYTSGSTGRPKGVVVPHRALVNFLHAMQRQLDLSRDDIFLAITSLSFDIAGLELYVPLLTGARVEIVSREVAGDGRRLAGKLAASRATVMQATPATWRMLLAAGWHGSRDLTMLCGGETLPRDLAHRLLAGGSHLWNLYGPTETTIWSTVAPVTAGVGAVPIGRPIANTQLYVLDTQLQPVPIGVPGELYIGGLGVARGYLNRPDLTAERFIPDPFSHRPGALLYKTGDQVRYHADGAVEYLGRLDHQVKIRGYRIELGEIEAVLVDHPAVDTAVAVAGEDHVGDLRLVAYVVPDEHQKRPPAPGELRDYLLARLPEYMVPSAFVLLDAWPLTPNGKVDRQALPEPDYDAARLEDRYVAPRTPTEEVLALLWSQVLGNDRVGAHDNFFELGGHSLSATQVVARVRDTFRVELTVRVFFEKPTLDRLADHIDELRRTTHGVQASPVRPLPRAEGMSLPLSFAQQRLWFLDQLQPGSAVDNVPQGLRMVGQLDVTALERALDDIVRRHETLRTCFPTVDGEPALVVAPRLKVELLAVDLSEVAEDVREMELQRRAAEEVRRPFDLSRGPLFRACLFRTSVREHALVITTHHIISDGWSFGVFLRELVTLYVAFSRGDPSPLLDLPIQFADFAGWQRAWLAGETLGRQLTYWRKQLTGAPPLLELPTDRQRPPVQTYRGAYHRFVLPKALTDDLQALSRREGTTLFMTLVAALDTLLHRYTRQDDIVVGSAVAGRVRPEVEELIGPFFNILALRTDLSGNPTFRELLGRVREVALGAYAHQDLPFEKLVEELQPNRDLSYDPLVQVVIHLHNLPLPTSLALPDLSLSLLEVDTGTVKSDLLFNFFEAPDGLACILGYNTDLFDSATIARLERHLGTLIEAVVRQPETQIDHLPILTPAERNQLVTVWNATQADFPRDACLHELVEAQVARSPNATAVIAEEGRLTYAELDRRATLLAWRLRALGVAPEVRVGVCMERSVELVAGLLGVLKAGGAYVPLDPVSPPVRLAAMLADAQPSVLLTQQRLLARLSDVVLEGQHILCLDDETLWADSASVEPLPHESLPEHIAYVIYTSGSTGTPKGVEIPHRGIVNRLHWMQQAYGLVPSDRVLQKTPYTFDVSVWEFFWPLLVGAALVLARPEGHRDNTYLQEVIRQQQITTLHFVPSMLGAFLDLPTLDGCQSLRRVICSGEALPVELMQRFFERLPGLELHNLYGPTEASVDVSAWACQPEPGLRSVPIGRPIANTQLYVLDAHMQPVPEGVPGELYIGGVGLARGYLHRPDLTAERFVLDPFSPLPGARLYRTGDFARYRRDGNIEYLGRLDNQIKLRGYRIELGEIEATLLEHPALQAAVVLARTDLQGELRLVAYLVPSAAHTLDHAELHSYLAQRLPDYMLPSSFVSLSALPLTTSGKVDRKALPEPEWAHRPAAAGSFTAPQTALERELAGIFAEMLGIEEVGANDSFFDLGGHSLLAMRLVFRLRDVFRVDLPLRSIFASPTAASLARAIERMQERAGSDKVDRSPRRAEAMAAIRADTVLDPAIVLAKTSDRQAPEPRHIFLTGATGFLGAFLLSELLKQTRARIHCLVRGRNAREARARLRQHLVSYGLWDEAMGARVSVAVGDLAQPRLGLSPEAFDVLARKIDTVYHAGAQPNFVLAYADLKPANVLGTQEVLKLATASRVKPLHYVSTLSVFSPHGDPSGRAIREDDKLDEHLTYLADGYDQSKWVAEMLVRAAGDQGLPVCIYRPGFISGHSETGVSNTDDLLSRAIKGSIQLGSIPQGSEAIRLTPVDYVSRAIVHLSLRKQSMGETFHLVNQRETSLSQIGDWLRAAGYQLRAVSWTAWRDELLQAATRSADNALYPLLPFLGEEGDDGQLFAAPRFDCRHSEQALNGSGIDCPEMDGALMRQYLAYFHRIRFIEDPPSAPQDPKGGGQSLIPAASAIHTAAHQD